MKGRLEQQDSQSKDRKVGRKIRVLRRKKKIRIEKEIEKGQEG